MKNQVILQIQATLQTFLYLYCWRNRLTIDLKEYQERWTLPYTNCGRNIPAIQRWCDNMIYRCFSIVVYWLLAHTDCTRGTLYCNHILTKIWNARSDGERWVIPHSKRANHVFLIRLGEPEFIAKSPLTIKGIQHAPMHHPLETCYDSVVDEP
jgi:hypothetical protein